MPWAVGSTAPDSIASRIRSASSTASSWSSDESGVSTAASGVPAGRARRRRCRAPRGARTGRPGRRCGSRSCRHREAAHAARPDPPARPRRHHAPSALGRNDSNYPRPVNVTLPDGAVLELPDGATALDAARAIGPKLAEQAVLARVDGETRDLRLPLPDGARLELLTTRDRHDPDALAVLRHSAAHLLAEAVRRLHPGVKVAIGPPIENGFYYDFEFPEPIREEDLAAIEDEIRRELAEGRSWERVEIGRDEARARFEAEGEPYKIGARRHRGGRHLALHAGRLHRPLPRPAPAGLEPDQGGQADRARRRVLARRRAEHAADAHLRHGVLHARPTSTPTSSGSSRRARTTTGGSGSSSTCSTSTSTRPARRSGTRRG